MMMRQFSLRSSLSVLPLQLYLQKSRGKMARQVGRGSCGRLDIRFSSVRRQTQLNCFVTIEGHVNVTDLAGQLLDELSYLTAEFSQGKVSGLNWVEIPYPPVSVHTLPLLIPSSVSVVPYKPLSVSVSVMASLKSSPYRWPPPPLVPKYIPIHQQQVEVVTSPLSRAQDPHPPVVPLRRFTSFTNANRTEVDDMFEHLLLC